MRHFAIPVTAAAAIVSVGTAPAMAEQIIRCTAPGKSTVDLVLDADRMLGHIVSCISGDFVSDMVPCAPAGRYAESSGAGIPVLVQITRNPRRLNFSSFVHHTISPTNIYFSGAFLQFDGTVKADWSFSLDRRTGQAMLSREKGSDVVDRVSGKTIQLEEARQESYLCRKVERKF